MKKSISYSLLFVLILLLSTPAYSQVGIRGGINLSEFVGEDVSETEGLLGLNAGFSFSLFNIGSVSLVPEIYYAEKGTRFTEQVQDIQNPNPDDSDFDPNYELEFNLAYVEIPVLAKVRLSFLNTKVIHPYIAGGPVFGFRLDCSISFSGNSAEEDIQDCADENLSDLEATFNESDRGYVLVSGIDFRVPLLGTVTLDARYYRGLSRLIKNNENDDIYNQNFTLMLGYTLDL